MENSTLNISVSSTQVILALLFQMWLVVFPVILIIKINRLTRLMEQRFGVDEEQENV